MTKPTHVAIFGANGNVGRIVVRYALADGLKVTAFIHKHHDLPDDPNLTIVRGDIYSKDDVAAALHDCDAVISTLSSWKSKSKDVLATAMEALIPAMQQQGISRIISLTGSEARAAGDSLGLIHRIAYIGISIVGGKVLRDGEKHIKLLRQSDLDWVVVRSPVMLPRDKQQYNFSDTRPRPWATIYRLAVARAMVDQTVNGTLSQQAPFIH